MAFLCCHFAFYTPVFRRDVLWYGDVRPGLRPTLRPSVRPFLRPPVFHTLLLYVLIYWAEILHMTFFQCTTDQVRVSSLCVNFWRIYASSWTWNIGNVQFSALFSYMLWHIELKFCIWLYFNVLQIKFECGQFASIFEGFTPLFELRILVMWSFPHFFPTCFDILRWNLAYDFVLMYYWSSLSVVILRQFLKELSLFLNLEYRKYTVFRSFLLHALTYWAEILHMTLFWCITVQVQASSLCVNFGRSYHSFELRI